MSGRLGALGVLEATRRRLRASGRPLEASWRSVLIVLDRCGVDLGPLLIPTLGPKSSKKVSVGTCSDSWGLQEPFFSISKLTSNPRPLLVDVKTQKTTMIYFIEDQIKQNIMGVIVRFAFR